MCTPSYCGRTQLIDSRLFSSIPYDTIPTRQNAKGPRFMAPGTLYVVATPIGNLSDITLRALEVLRGANVIAAEDTRRTRKLLTRHDISARLVSYHEHNAEMRSGQLVERLLDGENVALVCNAGTPCVSDPGYRLIRRATKAGCPVVPIPGASALSAALSVSGLPSDRFLFEGFLPRKVGKRRRRLEDLARLGITVIIYESPQRILRTLGEFAEITPEAQVVLLRELTKIHETILRGTAAEILRQLGECTPKGEITLVVHP